MMESLEFSRFWGTGEVGVGTFSDEPLLGDGLDGLFDELTSDFLFKPADGTPLDSSAALGEVEDWLDLKMDFSLLDCAENQTVALNDPLAMQKANCPDLIHHTHKGEKSTGVHAPQSFSSYTPPSSPESQVPDVSQPINVVNISSDRNLFASPPESPSYAAGSLTNVFSAPQLVHVFVPAVEATVITQQQPVCVSHQRDVRLEKRSPSPPAYAKPDISPTSSVLKLKQKVKLASGSSSRSSHGVKKERKRAQNKDAATRYRQKKRVASEYLSKEEEDLEVANQDLKTKIQSLSTEISYLKRFMREMFRAKGLLQ